MKKQTGFTLIELMIAVAIVAILAAVALPAYQTYVGKSKVSDLRLAAEGVQQQVNLCILDKGITAGKPATGCDNGGKGDSGVRWEIKAAKDYATDFVATVAVESGVITVTSNKDKLAADGKEITYIMKPTVGDAGQVKWALDTSSTCRTNEFC
jgi:type IV pilus assembly protein PilA